MNSVYSWTISGLDLVFAMECGAVHPGSRGPLRKLGQKLKRGSQIEPYRLFHSFNGLLFTILIHFRSNKARRKPFGGPFLVLVSNFFKKFSVESNSSCIRVHGCLSKHNTSAANFHLGGRKSDKTEFYVVVRSAFYV